MITHIKPIFLRIDRKIEFPLPDEKTKRRIFGIHTGELYFFLFFFLNVSYLPFRQDDSVY